MDGEVERLRQQVEELAGRIIADHAIMRQTLLTGSTPQLRATHAMVEKLADDSSVQAQFRALPHASRKAFEDKRKQWLQLVDQELASRLAAAPSN
jgi:hypothetical protein